MMTMTYAPAPFASDLSSATSTDPHSNHRSSISSVSERNASCQGIEQHLKNYGPTSLHEHEVRQPLLGGELRHVRRPHLPWGCVHCPEPPRQYVARVDQCQLLFHHTRFLGRLALTDPMASARMHVAMATRVFPSKSPMTTLYFAPTPGRVLRDTHQPYHQSTALRPRPFVLNIPGAVATRSHHGIRQEPRQPARSNWTVFQQTEIEATATLELR